MERKQISGHMIYSEMFELIKKIDDLSRSLSVLAEEQSTSCIAYRLLQAEMKKLQDEINSLKNRKYLTVVTTDSPLEL